MIFDVQDMRDSANRMRTQVASIQQEKATLESIVAQLAARGFVTRASQEFSAAVNRAGRRIDELGTLLTDLSKLLDQVANDAEQRDQELQGKLSQVLT
jgi:WXG100 family type VII secretion target